MATQIERATRQEGLHIPSLEETGRKLGEGSYGEVVEVKVEGMRYAGKKLHKIFYERDVPPADTAAIAQRFEEECRRMPQLKHPNIVQMIGVHFHPCTRQPTLVMELLDTSLTRYLEEHASAPPTIKHTILLGVASGLVYLHSLPPPLGPIIHRDLTANNVLLRLGEEVIAKIADLGQARIAGRNPVQMAQQQLTVCPGNVDHMPPEAQIDDPVYGTALDVFSFGVVMLHTLAHKWPKPLAQVDAARRVRSEVERRKTYLDKIEGSLLKPLVVECLRDSVESRPAAGELTGALKLAAKLHPQVQQLQEQQAREQQQHQELIHQIQSMTEAHTLQIQELQQQLKEQQQHKQRLEHSIHQFQQQLQAQHVQEQQQTKALEQQVRQLELHNQELVREHSEQKQKLEQEIQQHIQEKELLRDQQHITSSVYPQPGHSLRRQMGGASEGVLPQPQQEMSGTPSKAKGLQKDKSPSFIQPTFVNSYPQNVPPAQNSNRRDIRWEIIQGIRGIQPVAGKNLRDVEVPQRLYELAKEVAKKQPFHIRFKLVPVYRLLLDHIHVKGQDSVALSQAEATLAGWQQASKALFRYALNLVLAPKRPEFKKMKLSSSFYVHNVSRNLHEAEQVLIVMGYQLVERQGRGGQDLVYEGDVKTQSVLDTATDLLVMHEEIGLIRELMAKGVGQVMLGSAIMQQWQTNTPQNTRPVGVSRHQPPPGYSGYPLSPQEGSKGSYDLRNERGTSGGAPSQPPHQMMHGQQQHVAGHGGYSVGGGSRPPNLLPQMHASNVQRSGQTQGVNHTSHYAGHVPPAPGPAHAPAHEPPADATLYQNVPYRNDGSEFAIYQNTSDVLQTGAKSEGTLEHTTVTQEMRKLFQRYPELAGLPPQQKDTKQPALDDDASNRVSVDTQPGPPTEAEPPSFDFRDLPAPVVHYSSTPAPEFYSGITSSLVHSRSGGEGGRHSPVEEQPLSLGAEVNDPEYQRQLQQQHGYSQGRSPSTDSNMSIDLYGSGQSQQLEKLGLALYSRGRSTSTDSKESIDLYGSGSGDKLGKYALHTVHEEPTNPPSDLAPPHPSPSPLSRGTAHPLETNTQHPAGRPALQVQGRQGKRPERDMGKRPVPAPRALKQQVKSHSVDEVEQDGEGGGRKHHVMRTSASGSDLLQYERHSQSSEPSRPGRLEKPFPSPRRSRSPSPHSSTENSPSASPTPSRHKMPPVPEHSSQSPGSQLGVSMPPKAQSVDTETQRRKEIRRQNPVNRFSSGGLEAAAAELAHTSQASPSPAHGPEPPPTQKSSCDLSPNAPVMGISPLAAAAAAKRKQGDGSDGLGDTWVCSYCTNLVQGTLQKCEICGHEKLETIV